MAHQQDATFPKYQPPAPAAYPPGVATATLVDENGAVYYPAPAPQSLQPPFAFFPQQQQSSANFFRQTPVEQNGASIGCGSFKGTFVTALLFAGGVTLAAKASTLAAFTAANVSFLSGAASSLTTLFLGIGITTAIITGVMLAVGLILGCCIGCVAGVAIARAIASSRQLEPSSGR